jgi:hypothetical protein
METWVMGVGLRLRGKPRDEPPDAGTIAPRRSIPISRANRFTGWQPVLRWAQAGSLFYAGHRLAACSTLGTGWQPVLRGDGRKCCCRKRVAGVKLVEC